VNELGNRVLNLLPLNDLHTLESQREVVSERRERNGPMRNSGIC